MIRSGSQKKLKKKNKQSENRADGTRMSGDFGEIAGRPRKRRGNRLGRKKRKKEMAKEVQMEQKKRRLYEDVKEKSGGICSIGTPWVLVSVK